MPRNLDPSRLGLLEDWQGNNIALACPACLKVFIVSGLIHRNGRDCPNCGKSKAFVTQDGRAARVECNEQSLPLWHED
jgi:hypothetical protein